MIPKRIELENFLSFGKPAIEFTFTDDEPLWALCGRNGIGKSAVFDGITYALYGQHRGGTQKAEHLIRHGANSFRIVFEFEFDGVDYRITRGRGGRTWQKVECRVDGEWVAVPGVNSADDVKTWVEKTLGLGFKAFTTSLLLRQGEAEKLFSASRDERIGVLKGIIGFERFEEISGRVHAETLCRGNTLDTLRHQTSGLVPVTPEELAGADDAVTLAEQNRDEAQTALTAAVQRVEQAKQWGGLETKRISLEQHLAAAEQRAADAVTIRTDKSRLDDLATAVPELKTLLGLRDKIAGLEPKIPDAEAKRTMTVTAIEASAKASELARQKEEKHKQQAAEFDRKAKSLGQEIERGTSFLQLAETLEQLKEKLAAYPADLANQVAQAEAEEKLAEDAKGMSATDLAAAKALLKQAEDRRDQFAEVKVGVRCSRCGQPVDEAHAAKERAQIAKDVKKHERQVTELSTKSTAAAAAFTKVRKHRVALQNDKTEFDKIATQLQATSTSLEQLGGISNAATLRTRLAKQEQEKQAAEGHAAAELLKQAEANKEADRLDQDRKTLETQLQTQANTIRTLEIQLATDRAGYNGGFGRLTAHWQDRLPKLDVAEIGKLATELTQLQTSGVAARFELLRQDDEKRTEWTRQLEEVRTESERIPAEARVSVKEAEQRQGEAKLAADRANGIRDTAVQTRDGLRTRAQEYERLTAQLRTAERAHDVHKKLDDLLGQNGLQRELVRDAEQQIVALANDTLQNLSDGELSLEQDDDAAGREDKAFALRVRRVGDPFPIGVLFLSGSQKFRVAVSVALAVGRFACGRARPLEAVIIDEGFGSLDKDGLRAMADELKRLQQLQELKRVILVSHQDEFTDQFPVGYRLSNGENGTTAAPFRR